MTTNSVKDLKGSVTPPSRPVSTEEMNEAVMDATSETTAAVTVQIDDDQVRVTRWDFPPGTQTGTHTHEYDYVVVPISTGTLTVQTDEGEVANPLVPGASYQRAAGSTHNVVNENDHECSFVEIELKLAP